MHAIIIMFVIVEKVIIYMTVIELTKEEDLPLIIS